MMPIRILFFSLIAGGLLAGCKRSQEGPFYSAMSQAQIQRGKSFTEGKLFAIRLAENRARNQILNHIMDRPFPNGIRLEEAVVTDPFIQAKIYDSIRNAKIVDQTINEEGVVTVTVRLNLAPIQDVLSNADYAREVADRGVPVTPRAARSDKPTQQ